MTQLLTSLYEQNETYHEVKERMTWQAAAIYLGFSLLFMNWLHSNAVSGKLFFKLLLTAVAFVPAFGFMRKQIYLKALSAKKGEKYVDFMHEYPEPSEKQFKQLISEIKCLENLRGYEKRRTFRKEKWPGQWALIAIWGFLVVQVLLVFYFSMNQCTVSKIIRIICIFFGY
jgi:hypothetical protein